MYAVQFVDGEWWVGFRYSDGRFDKITSYGRGAGVQEMAEHAATRMNGRSR